uniref:LUCI_1 protein n=2 Tax=Fopius arisanus TaxID=64838 RepID=A0A0C9Q8B8_9HYME
MFSSVEINVLDQLPKLTMKNGIIKAETYPYRQDENNIGKILLTGMRKNPKLVNQIDAATGKEDTFGEIADRTVKCAVWLVSQGVKPGDVVAICTHNHIDTVVPVVACLCIGAIFNPWWDHGLNRDTAKHFMALTTPKVIFINEDFIDIVSEVAHDLNMRLKIVGFGGNSKFECFDDIIRKCKPKDVESFQCTELSTNEKPAYIEYTSGSTGLPKGALHSHKSLFGNVMNVGTFGGCNNVVLCYSNLCWITGVLCTLSSIAYFQKRIIAAIFTPQSLCELVEKYKITWILTGTSAANRLLKSGLMGKYDLSSLKSVWIGGAVFKQEAQDALQAALPGAYVIQLYGTTETGGVSIHQTRKAKPNSVGTLARCFEMKIIDPDSDKVLSANEKGELCVKSPFMMTEYYKDPEKTRELIKADGWLHTGDQAYYDSDGAVYIIDRLKELIKWRGHHASPSVIEQMIMTYPGVTEAGVVGVPDWEDDERPIAFVAKSPEATISENDIKKMVQDNLPEQMWLRGGVRILDQMPHTASGKIARTVLKEMAKEFIRNS